MNLYEPELGFGRTRNSGLKGGNLDARAHIERAEDRTCFPDEIAARRTNRERLMGNILAQAKPAHG